MFRKQDFKKIDLLGSGKKNTKIYKAEHIPTGKFYAIKEVEAKTLDKLNEYKEEAVQLFKVQNHPNVLQFYGYYFYETMYNTFRIAMVCEYMDHRTNLEYMFRKRKQQNQFWKQDEFEKMIVSIISTLSYLQQVGICHRDLKPANLFLNPQNGEIKIIDFGESKDYFKDQDDGGMGTMATIRGTPQYLSPILWRAHVEEGGNTRHVTHNIFKSDVFSCGLIFFQLASMEDVTGFNQKNQVNDGEKLIEQGLKKLRQRYSDHIIEIVRLMLKFDEAERPSFIELAKLVLTSTENSIESPKAGNKPAVGSSGSQAVIQKSIEQQNQNKRVNKTFSNQNIKEGGGQVMLNLESQSSQGMNLDNKRGSKAGGASQMTQQMLDSQQQLMTQSELFKSYAEQNHLYLNLTNQMFWFEFGGNKIGRLFIEGPEAEEFPKWRLIAKYKGEFPCHFTLVYVNGGAVGTEMISPQQNKNIGTWFLLGGMGNNCLQYIDKNIVPKASMLQEKSFFSAVAVRGSHIYTFGGYENVEKCQLKSCEVYSIDKDRWHSNDEIQLHEARSQSAAALFDDNIIYIFGGYNKEVGTLSSIERYDISRKRITKIELAMPIPLRRFAAMKISSSKILLLGGVGRLSKDSDAVFCFDVETGGDGKTKYSIENLDKVDKAGVIDYPVILDSVGSLHLFIENSSGTSPPQRSVYSFLEYS